MVVLIILFLLRLIVGRCPPCRSPPGLPFFCLFSMKINDLRYFWVLVSTGDDICKVSEKCLNFRSSVWKTSENFPVKSAWIMLWFHFGSFRDREYFKLRIYQLPAIFEAHPQLMSIITTKPDAKILLIFMATHLRQSRLPIIRITQKPTIRARMIGIM